MNVQLPALTGNSPVGFMTAVGLLRIAPAGCRLSWDPVTQMASLDGVEPEALLDHLVEHMAGRGDSPELKLADCVRGMTSVRYREIVATTAPEALPWVRAWWRE